MVSKLLKKEIKTTDIESVLVEYKENADKYIGAYEYKQAIAELLALIKENKELANFMS